MVAMDYSDSFVEQLCTRQSALYMRKSCNTHLSKHVRHNDEEDS